MVNKNSFFKLIPLVLGVLVISFVLSFWAVAWTEPQENPPDGNASSPLNVGSSGQTKTGWLATLDSLWVGLEGSGGWPGMLRVLNGALINTNGAPVGLIVAQGNVGIGTTTIPSQRLDVNGQVRATDVCTTAGTCLSTAGGGFSKWTDSGSNIYNNNTGNVGIGKNNPSEKLDVNGNIKASGDICTGSKCLNSVGGGTNYWVGGSGSSIYYNSGNVGVGNLTLNPNGRITGLINPTVNSGAVPKSYADHFFAAPRTEPMECRLTYAARTISSTNPALTWTVSCASDEVAISGGVQTNGVFNLYVSSWPGPLNKDWTCVANYYAVVPGSQIASCYARCCKQTMMIMRYLEYCTYYGYAGCGLSNPPPLP